MEIRAVISLAIDKFKTNAAIVGSVFKSMTSDADKYAQNVDGYIQRNLENRLKAIEQVRRAEQQSLTFSAKEQAAAAKGKIGNTALGFGVGTPSVELLADSQRRKGALEYTSAITDAERKATAESIKLKNAAATAATEAENRRYLEWQKINGAESLKRRKIADEAKELASNLAKVSSAEFEAQMPRIRYALYDVARNSAAVVATITGIGIAAVNVARQFESSFTSVERTSGAVGNRLAQLRADLIQLSREIPVAFQDVTRIATLGAQMGIAAESLKQFTETVARFATITGISVEESAIAFGRLAELMNVPVAQFENLSSAITYAGVNAVATDLEIIRMSESIAAASTQAGITADGVIGLSTALASLKIRPEEARGAIQRLFRTIDIEATRGGKRFADFSKVMGMTMDQTKELWKQDPQQFITSFLQAAGASGRLNEVITALGITNVRELNVITRLGNNIDVLTSSMADAEEQFLLGAYSTEAYAMVADDLASKLTVLNNNVQAIIEQFGAPLGEALKPILDFVNGLLENIKFIPPAFVFVVAAIGAVTAAFAGMIMTKALLIAGLLALKTAIGGLGGQMNGLGINMKTVTLLLKELNVGLGITTKVSQGAAASTNFLSTSLQRMGVSAATAGTAVRVASASLGILSLVGVVLVGVWQAIDENSKKAAESIEKVGKASLDANGGAQALAAAMLEDTKAGKAASNAIGELTVKLDGSTKAADETRSSQLEAAKAHQELVSSIGSSTDATDENIDAINDSADAQEEANKKTREAIDLTNEQTLALGNNTKAFLLNALRKYSGENGEIKDFVLQQIEDPEAKALAETFGFDIIQLIESGMEDAGKDGKGAQKYLAGIQEQYSKFVSDFLVKVQPITVFDTEEQKSQKVAAAVRELGNEYGWTQSKIATITASMQGLTFEQLKTINVNLPEYYSEAAFATDGMITSTQSAIAADGEFAQILNRVGAQAEDTGDEIEDLSSELNRYVNAALGVQGSNNDVIDSFVELAAGTNKTDGSIKGFSKNARNNFKNWSNFVQAATKAATEDFSGTAGVVGRLAAAITVLGNEGLDTSGQFETLRDTLTESFADAGAEYLALQTAISTAPDLTGLNASIDALLQAALAAAIAGRGTWEYYNSLSALKAGLANTDYIQAFKDAWAEAMKGIETGADKAKSAFDKLRDAIKATFEELKNTMAVNAALASLAESLNENGAAFDTFTKSGRSNIDALLGLIDSMVERFGKDPQKLANQLVTLRQALINSGNGGARAIGLINKALEATGKNGKKAQGAIKNLTAQIKTLTSTQARVVGLANSIKSLGDSMSEYLDATYLLGNTQMDIAVGWEAIANSAKEAAGSIKDVSDELNKIQADRNVLEYQLKIAMKYGDTLRANQLRAEIAELDKRKQEVIAEGNQVSDTPLADLKAREDSLQEQVNKYALINAQEVIGIKGKKNAKVAIDGIVAGFVAAAKDSGIAAGEAEKYGQRLADALWYARQLAKANKYKVTAETDKALKEIKDFASEADAAIRGIKDKVTVKVTTQYQKAGGGVVYAANGGRISGPGTGTSDSIPAMLSNGEYVVRAAAVRSYGLDFMNALNNMTLGASYNGPTMSAGSQSSGVVYLSPEDRNLLREAIDRPINLYTENTKIAQSANNGNVLLAQRGLA